MRVSICFVCKLYVTSFLILIAVTAHSQGWQLLNPAPTFHDIRSITFPVPDTGFVSDGFNLYKTVDGGDSWKLMYLPFGYIFFESRISDVKFSSTNKGFLLHGGSVFITENSGDAWIEHNLTWAVMDKIYIKSDLIIYIYGENERMYKSLDGGDTWSFVSMSQWDETFILEMEMVDEQNGYLISVSHDDTYWLRRTTDGGVFWNEYISPVVPRTLAVKGIEELYVGGEEQCNAVPCQARIYHTRDACLTWDTINVDTSLAAPVVAEALSFFNDLEGYMANDLQTFTTIDGGETWTTASMTSLFPEGYNLNVHSWPDPFHGYIGGEDGLLIKTSDRGLTYNSMSQGFNADIKGVYFMDTLNGFISGDDFPQPVILRTSDGGFTWDTCIMEMPAIVTGMVFTDDIHGWATFGDGIFVTSDGGLIWNIGYYLPQQMRFSEISAPDYNHLYAFSPAAVSFSGDGGYTWVDRSPIGWLSGGFEGRCMAFADSLTGYCILQHPWGDEVVTKTTDGGITWFEVLSGEQGFIYTAIDFYDADNGAVYLSNSVKVTHDGGQTWLMSNGLFGTTDILMPDPQTVIVVGPTGSIDVSYNGGISFSTLYQGYNMFDLSIKYHMIDEEHGYAIGNDGMVMRYSAYYTGVKSPPLDGSVSSEAPFFCPNPAGETITITEPGTSSVNIYTMSGQCIMSCTVYCGGNISLSQLPEGFYLITMTTQHKRRLNKLVKL